MEQENQTDSVPTKCETQQEKSYSTIPGKTIIVLLAFTVATAVLLELTPLVKNFYVKEPTNATVCEKKPTYAVYGKSPEEYHLVHVFKVLKRFGYERVPIDATWDLLWAHDYPFFKMPERMRSLQTHQLVNHIPGCGFLTNKVDLSTTPLPFLPVAFRLPQQRAEFLAYAENNKQALFVEKHNEHRHIVIKPVNEINLNGNATFVQEFIQKPFLVDGFKFDIGVYVLITSVDPLLAYIYKGDVLFRYCPQPYYPLDPKNVDKYVVGDDYLPTWEVPSLRKYYNNFGSNMRDSFDAYVRDQAKDPALIWQQVEHIVRETILAKHADLAATKAKYKSGHFFELMRFDLVIDEELRVYLMEANMSPNLSSAHFTQNAILYEQILYSALQLAGVNNALEVRKYGLDEMISAERNIVVDINACAKHNCDKSCHLETCEFCAPCLSGKQLDKLLQAHREHLHRADMQRIYPKPLTLNSKDTNTSNSNKWLSRWYLAKCQQDQSYC